MSRSQIDQFIDDEEEEVCPLCVEEFDLSDRNFRPCPCGYQICQFCYNNIKTTMNGLCPACRRPYDDKSIEWKVISPEEMANYKADLALQAKKKAAQRQKEAQKREADSLSRKHLAGLRVVQKNLVYVTGLNPTSREDKLLEVLRGDQYFGQYGKIVKIVVSKAKDSSHPQQSVGVYVTFARKEDAAACIAAVDGSVNGDRVLRAQYGTTKYCSAYLRNEQCNNRNCMFLHEPGEASDSFTRQDLSSMNVISTQNPSQQHAPASTSHFPQPPPQQAPQPIASATQMGRQDSQGSHSPLDGPALPSHASWANKPPLSAQARRPSQGNTDSEASPRAANATPAPIESNPNSKKTIKTKESASPAPESAKETAESSTLSREDVKRSKPNPLNSILKNLSDGLGWTVDWSVFSALDSQVVQTFPCMIDLNGADRRKLLKEKAAATERQKLQETQALQEAAAAAAAAAATQEQEEQPTGSGSLQLGGEPEEQADVRSGSHSAIQPPQQPLGGSSLGLGQNLGLPEDMSSLSLNGRSGLTTQQQQQFLLQQFKSTNTGTANLFHGAQSQHLPAGMQGGNSGNHTRQASRFTFANDTHTATSNVKPVANAKLMSQQSSMMPNNHFSQISQHQPLGNQFYTSSVQGPPPGLKTTGTPPVSGGGMFGQGHGFATSGLGYGANAMGRNVQEEAMRELLRGRGGNAGVSQVHDSGKRELMFPSLLHQNPTATSTPSPAPGLLNFPYGPQPGTYQESGSQKQKKKGKKHRHANTSSSGGGVVDVADPSILQARLHQGGGMVGQGLYTGQGQVSEQDSLSQSIDALVNEPDTQTPALPAAELSYLFNQPRRATPTVPPGLSAPTSRVGTPASASIRPPPGIPTPQANAIAPAVPDLPTSRVSTPSRATNKEPAERSKATDNIGLDASETPTIEKPDTAKVMATKADDTSKRKPETGPKTKSADGVLLAKVHESKEEEKAKDINKVNTKDQSPKANALQTKWEKIGLARPKPGEALLPKPKDEKHDAEGEKPELKSGMSTAKRQHPGMLQIPKKETLNQEREPSSAGAESATKNPRTVSLTATSTSRPATPTGTAAGSPLKRTGPSIMRITNTPKMESPPAVSASAPVSAFPNPSVASIRSRQPSIASVNQAPGTPMSEFISDAASMTSASASISRTNSPPPAGRVGSAPARTKTKSQAKKERQEKAKLMAEQEIGMKKESRAASEEPIIQEGIQTRKRKEKKEKKKPVKTAKSTPTETPTGTPAPEEVPEESTVVETISQEAEKPKEEVEDKRAPQPLTASQIVAKLLANGDITHEQIENMFKSFPQGPNERQITLQDAPNRGREYELADDDARAILENNEIQRLGGEDGRISSRVLISGSGRILRCLSKCEEDQYLQVEARLRSTEPPHKWTPTKEPVFDIEAIMRDLCIQDVIERQYFSSRRQQRPGSSTAASAAGAADSNAAQLALDEAANYNDEFIVPSDPADASTSYVADEALPVKKARHAVETQKQHLAARLASTPRGIAASGLPLFPYVTLNGISLTDNAGLLLGIDFGNGSGTNYNHSTAGVGVGVGKGRNAAGGASAVSPSLSSSAAAVAPSPAFAGPMPSLQMVEKELNAEKQRANEATKRLNQAAKRVRKIVQTGSGWGGAAPSSAPSPSASTQ